MVVPFDRFKRIIRTPIKKHSSYRKVSFEILFCAEVISIGRNDNNINSIHRIRTATNKTNTEIKSIILLKVKSVCFMAQNCKQKIKCQFEQLQKSILLCESARETERESQRIRDVEYTFLSFSLVAVMFCAKTVGVRQSGVVCVKH